MNIKIERATPDDVNSLIQVQDKAFLEDFETYGECPGYGKTYQKMLTAIENKFVFKITVDGKIVGDIIVVSQSGGHYHLGGLCVIPEYENKGIGQQAMLFLDTYFGDAVHWSLKTPADKWRNHYFYEKCGFHIAREYTDGAVTLAVLERDIPCKEANRGELQNEHS